MTAWQAAWLRIWALMKKEFLMMWLDKGTRKILFIPILVQCVIFGYGATFNLEKVPLTLLDESHSVQSMRLCNELKANSLFDVVQECLSQQCLQQSLSTGQAVVGLHLPVDFATHGQLYLIADARNTTAANTALGYIEQSLVADSAQAQLQLNFRYYYNEHNITRYSFLTSMILALTLIQITLLSSLTVAREREEGNFDMLLLTPATPLEILIGKALPPTITACMQSLLLFLICRFYFAIPLRGSFLLLSLVVVLFALAVVGLGLAISALARSAQQALITAFIIALPCVILSGLITPLAAMPPALQVFVKCVNPLYYGIEALQRIYLEGAGFMAIYHLLIPLLICASITLPIARYLFDHQLD
ncbi:MAG: ABC transporter permease [Candidatus Anaerobiospirillum merdipullorum]|uniref:Transport permease protein n=1 Tax=Candidatus Anaerobiospirillum merdipullorum TaxID=2838450 RepID=A0A9E2KMA3_9GAMM|nr:ABC transporter permease [Candidatus Anaerobiospirillum merdipullorum]